MHSPFIEKSMIIYNIFDIIIAYYSCNILLAIISMVFEFVMDALYLLTRLSGQEQNMKTKNT